jgi:hypothetical protein
MAEAANVTEIDARTGTAKRAAAPQRLAGLVTACVLAAGCQHDQVRSAGEPPADTGAAAGQPVARDGTAWQRCTHAASGLIVEFPGGWHTNDGSVMPACTLFDPQPIAVPPASEVPEDIAVMISVEDVAFERIATSTFGLRVLSREELQLAGRRAIRQHVEHTGDGLLDAGVQSWQYIVAWDDGRTLTAHSHDVGDPDFATKRRVLDEMISRLQWQ